MISLPDTATTVPLEQLLSSEEDLRFFTHNRNKLREVAKVEEIAAKFAEIMTYSRYRSLSSEMVQLMQRTLAGQTGLQVTVYEIPESFKARVAEMPYHVDGTQHLYRAVYFEDEEGNLLCAGKNEVLLVPEELYDHPLYAYDVAEGLRAAVVPSFNIKETDLANLPAGMIGVTVYIDHSKP